MTHPVPTLTLCLLLALLHPAWSVRPPNSCTTRVLKTSACTVKNDSKGWVASNSTATIVCDDKLSYKWTCRKSIWYGDGCLVRKVPRYGQKGCTLSDGAVGNDTLVCRPAPSGQGFTCTDGGVYQVPSTFSVMPDNAIVDIKCRATKARKYLCKPKTRRWVNLKF